MLFNIILFAMVAAIAYFHYTQGLFSGALSAILCVLAAMLAIGYHEMVASYVIAFMKMPEEADAISLIVIFAAAYGIGRLLFDRMVPGNVRFPLMMDKIGSAAFGFIAGLFATGILALAAQSMPFGPTIGGFARQDISTDPRTVTIPGAGGSGRALDTTVSDELMGEGMGDANHTQHLWLHQEDTVLGLARQLSQPGAALSYGTALDSVHPDYALEMFGQRLGTPGGIRKLLVNSDKMAGVRVSGAYALAKTPPHIDAMSKEVRGEAQLPDIPTDMTLVAVRVDFESGAGLTDATDPIVRLSPAGVRLKAGNTDYYPLGTMAGPLLLQNRSDDPLMIDMKSSQTVDFLFAVNPDDINLDTQGGDKKRHFKPGTFLEVMRYAQADLSGMELTGDAPQAAVAMAQDSDTLGGVIRQAEVLGNATAKINVTASPAGQQSQNSDSGKGRLPNVPKPDNLRGKDSDFDVNTPGQGMGL